MGKFNFIETGIQGLFVIEPTVFNDQRGYTMESYNQKEFFDAGLTMTFVQDNESGSVENVLRGLHFQRNNPQGKLVRVIKGEVFDVAVDIRKDSPSFGQSYSLLLSDENKKQFYIPPGFAHGFMVVSPFAEFVYKLSTFYDPNDQCGILWSDSDLNIPWPILPEHAAQVILSEKDAQYLKLSQTLV